MSHQHFPSAPAVAVDFKAAFEAIPGNFIILQPNSPDYTILAISDDLLQITSRQRHQVVGKSIFEVFPENREAVTDIGTSNLRLSLQNAVQFKKPDQMPVARHDVPNADGVFKTRYWSSVSKPVLDAAGEVQYLIHTTTDYENPTEKVATGFLGVAHDVTEQVLARERLQESEARFLTLVEEATVATALYLGPDFQIKYANATMLKIMGKNASVVGQSFKEAMPELQGQPFFNLLDHVYTTGETYVGKEDRADVRVNGQLQTFYFNFSYKALRHSTGEIYGILNMAVDVTEQVLSRKKVEENANQLNHLANAMPQVVWMADANGEVTYFNNRISDLTGAQKFPDGTWRWAGVLAPEDVEPTVAAWAKAVAEGTFYEKEHRLQTKSGHYRWHLSRAFPQIDESGTVVRWYGTATDVHEQKEYQEALRQSEEQLRIAMDGGELGTFNFYPQARKLIWSAKTKELMGLPPEAEEYPEIFQEAVHPEDRERCSAVVQKAMQPENGGNYENEYRVIGIANGMQRWLRSKGKVSFDEEGKAVRLTGVTQDVTDRKKAEEALEIKNAQLVRINNDLDNFIYTASHDLKAPIGNIEGLLLLLSSELSTGKIKEHEVQHILDLMLGSVKRFRKTIGHLTDIIKLQNNHDGEVTAVNFAEVVQEVLLDLDQLIQSSGARIEADLQHCETVSFSAKNLRSIVYNLVSNAIKYRSPERPLLVQLFCREEPGFAVFTVHDNGSGLHKKHQGQLFTMFRRFNDQVEGTGIGLYMVKKMLDNAGGRIEVESQEGEGTTFRVYFRR